MRETRTSGSVGAPGRQRPGATWPSRRAVSHDRPFVDALRPSHALHLPEERYELWREEYLDDVEMR